MLLIGQQLLTIGKARLEMEEYSYIMPLIHKPEDVGCVFKVVKTVHYDSIVTRIDSIASSSVLTQVHDFYASSFSNLLEVISIAITIAIALLGVKIWIDHEEIKEFKERISNFEERLKIVNEKITIFEKMKHSYTEHIIQMWLNLGRLKEREGNERFAYMCFMNVLDLLGQDFHKEDYDVIKCGGMIKKLKEKDTYKRRTGECSPSDEIKSIRRVVDKLKEMPDEKETIADLNDLINARLAQSHEESENRFTKQQGEPVDSKTNCKSWRDFLQCFVETIRGKKSK